MPIDRDFPDAVSMPDGSLRLVTHAARSWIYQNTKVKRHYDEPDDLPRFVLPVGQFLEEMRLDGLVIRTKRSSQSKRIA